MINNGHGIDIGRTRILYSWLLQGSARTKKYKDLHVLLVPCAVDNCLLILVFLRPGIYLEVQINLTIDEIEDIKRLSSHPIGDVNHCLHMI